MTAWKPIGLTMFVVLPLVVGCGGDDVPDEAEDRQPAVVAVNRPLEEFARRLGGDTVEVVCPVPGGVDPAKWRPRDEDVLAMQQADVVLLNGAQFSKWLNTVSLSDSLVVDTSRRFRDRYVVVEDFQVHRHGSEGEHSHPGTAPNTFLDPALALQQAEMVRNTLVALVPAEKESVESRFEPLAAELREIDEAYGEVLKDAPSTPVFASHPFCAYVARRANWEVVHLHWQPDEDPGPAKWEQLEEKLIDHPAKWMLFAEQPLPETEARLAELGIAVAVIDPASTLPVDGGFPDVLRANLETARKVVQNERP